MSTNSCKDSAPLHDFVVATNFVILVASCFAAVANVLVIYCAYMIYRRNHVYTHLLIIMMSIADFLLSAYAYPMSSLQLVLPSIQSVGFCASAQICVWLGQALSSWFLTVINADRLYFFHFPMKYILLTKKYVIAVCALVVTSSFGSVGALWLTNSVYLTNTCTTAFTHGGRTAYLTFIAATCALPIASSFGLSTYLFVLTSRRRNTSPSRNFKSASKRSTGSLLFMFTMSLWTLFSLLPSRLFLSWFFLVHDKHSCPGDVFFWLTWTSNLLIRLSPTINPLVTGLLCAPYKRELARIMAQVKSVVNRHVFRIERM